MTAQETGDTGTARCLRLDVFHTADTKILYLVKIRYSVFPHSFYFNIYLSFRKLAKIR